MAVINFLTYIDADQEIPVSDCKTYSYKPLIMQLGGFRRSVILSGGW